MNVDVWKHTASEEATADQSDVKATVEQGPSRHCGHLQLPCSSPSGGRPPTLIFFSRSLSAYALQGANSHTSSSPILTE